MKKVMKKYALLGLIIVFVFELGMAQRYTSAVTFGSGVPTFFPSTSKKEGTLYTDNSTGQDYNYSGAVWYALGNIRQSAAPSITFSGSGFQYSNIRAMWTDTDDGKIYRVNSAGNAWAEITGASAVTAVNGQTGAVTLTKTDIGLSNADNTSDANKPISTATQTALNAKQANLVSGTNIKTVNGSTLLGSGDLVISGGSAAVYPSRVFSGGADIKYWVVSGTPTLSFSKASGVGTVSVSGGVAELDRVQLNLTNSDLDGSNLFTCTFPTTQSSTFFQYPSVMQINTQNGASPSSVPHTVRNSGSAPVVTFTGGTAGTNIIMKTGDLTVMGSPGSYVLVCNF